MDINSIIVAIAIVGVIGLIFGCILSLASIIFSVKSDEREEMILDFLPGANCGACGYAGCSAYAEAIVKNNAPVNACSVGKNKVAQQIARIMGVESKAIEPRVAKVMCGGDCSVAQYKYEYKGIKSCEAAVKLAGGAKTCPSGCLGLGSCVDVCPFNAISIQDQIAVVDDNKCQACGMCVNKCPKNLIKMVEVKNKVAVLCSNSEKGNLTNKYCSKGCIGCKICEKVCPVEAIKVIDNFAHIDYTLCINCGECALKCPKKVLVYGG